MSLGKYNLFLDDERDPLDITWGPNAIMYQALDWVIVRDYASFCSHILHYGHPRLVSFDHDPAAEHYAPNDVQLEFASWEEWQNAQRFVEPTGLECARWLIRYCRENALPFPLYLVHSKNPVGAKNIVDEIRAYSIEYRREHLE